VSRRKSGAPVSRKYGCESVDAFVVAGLRNTTVLQANYKQQRFSAHTHPTYVLSLVTTGGLRFSCEGKVWTAPAGSICLINPGEVQTGEPVNLDGWAYWSAYLAVDSMRSVTDEKWFTTMPPFFPARVIHDEDMRAVLERFFVQIRALKHPLAQAELSSTCLSALLERFSCPRREELLRPNPLLVRTVKDYLASHFSEPVSLDQAASVVDVSGYHLTRMFKLSTGLTMHAWLVQLRVERAQDMLIRGYPMAEVASDCGFSDQPHMNRWFRRILGMTPGNVQAMSRTFKTSGL
jgi:AraC-like DNA-binding protein